MKFDTLLFDLDGTLLDTLDDLTDSVNQVLSSNNYPLRKREEIRAFLGNGARELLKLSLPLALQEEIGEKDTPLLNGYIKEFQENYQKNMDNNTKPYEGMMELLNQLKDKGFKLAIVSNKYDQAVKELSIQYFGEIFPVSSGETQEVKRKPAPDTLLKAIEELESDPARSILIGDSEVDIKAAKNARIPSIAVSWGFRDREELEKTGADYIVDTTEEILDIVL